MLNRQNIIFTLVALAIAGIFTYIVTVWTSSDKDQERKKLQAEICSSEFEILVAAEDLPVGRRIKHKDIIWQKWTKETLIPAYALKSNRQLTDFLDAIVKSPINKGQPIVDELLIKPNHRSALAQIIKPGMRAIAIDVDSATSIAGFIVPGDYVDILTTIYDKENNKNTSDMIAQNILILAVDQMISKDEQNQIKIPKTVTLEVSKEQATLLIDAKRNGKLTLSLHGLMDNPNSNDLKDSKKS